MLFRYFFHLGKIAMGVYISRKLFHNGPGWDFRKRNNQEVTLIRRES